MCFATTLHSSGQDTWWSIHVILYNITSSFSSQSSSSLLSSTISSSFCFSCFFSPSSSFSLLLLLILLILPLFLLTRTLSSLLQFILKHVVNLIYVDTDILFLRPIENLDSFFDEFDDKQLAAMSPEHENPNIGWSADYGVTRKCEILTIV